MKTFVRVGLLLMASFAVASPGKNGNAEEKLTDKLIERVVDRLKLIRRVEHRDGSLPDETVAKEIETGMVTALYKHTRLAKMFSNEVKQNPDELDTAVEKVVADKKVRYYVDRLRGDTTPLNVTWLEEQVKSEFKKTLEENTFFREKKRN